MIQKRQNQVALTLTVGMLFGLSAQSAPFPGSGGLSIGGFSLPARTITLRATLQLQLQGMGLQIGAPKKVQSHGIVTHRYQIRREGLEVLGGVAMTHEGPEGVALTDESVTTSFDISTEPRLASKEASRIALGILGQRDLQVAPVLKILPSESGDASAQLIYWVTISPSSTESGRDLLIHANQGHLIADISHDLEIAPTEVLMANDQCQTVPEGSSSPLQLNPDLCAVGVQSGVAHPGADETAIRADSNSQAVLKYYWSNHGRDSFDDLGSKVRSVVHVGKAFANAFWSSDRNFMAYGDGDGVIMTDLTKALDVAGHEMTHGVTAHTAQLIYASESGALNEAFSDFFGVVIAARANNTTPDWAVGKEIFLSDRKLVGLRNLKDPASINARVRDDDGNLVVKPYPGHTKDQFKTKNACGPQNDRCFVHINSMIPGRAMYLISEAVGLDRAEKLLYVTLTQYLTKTSNFKTFRTQTLKACRQLYNSQDCSKVRLAFGEVGL